MTLEQAVAVLNREGFRDCTTWKVSSLPPVGPFPEYPFVAMEYGEGQRIASFEAIAIAKEYERLRLEREYADCVLREQGRLQVAVGRTGWQGVEAHYDALASQMTLRHDPTFPG